MATVAALFPRQAAALREKWALPANPFDVLSAEQEPRQGMALRRADSHSPGSRVGDHGARGSTQIAPSVAER
jgi:hypothetical protein